MSSLRLFAPTYVQPSSPPRPCSTRGLTLEHRGARPPQPLMIGFIDTLRADGHAVESMCRVLREQSCQIAARIYRSWKSPQRRIATRTLCDAEVVDVVRDPAWAPCPKTGRPTLAPEGL